MFNRSTAHILERKTKLTGEENTRSQIVNQHAEPGNQSWVMEVEGVTADHYANLTSLDALRS